MILAMGKRKNLGLDKSPEEEESGAASLPTQVSLLQPGIARGIVLNFQDGKNAILIRYWFPTISETDLAFQLCETCSLSFGLEAFPNIYSGKRRMLAPSHPIQTLCATMRKALLWADSLLSQSRSSEPVRKWVLGHPTLCPLAVLR